MLKWVVNGSRPTYLEAVSETEATNQSLTPNVSYKRKFTSSYICYNKSHVRHKEHQLTSTPLPCANYNPLFKLDPSVNLDNVGTVLRTREHLELLETPEQQLSNYTSMPKHYACTLPTYEVEYSPCGLIPGPLLALRGISIPDAYFEQPRYLTQITDDTIALTKSAALPTNSHSTETAQNTTLVTREREHELSLSSTKMGDVTLEHMIDAILQSTRKERKLPRNAKSVLPRCASSTMSPTYTPADDPASDLHEFWHLEHRKSFQRNRKVKYREREVCSPVVRRWNSEQVYQLKRQRAMRRKRKICKITASVKSSAQQLLSSQQLEKESKCPNNVAELNDCADTSPDSGHNSFSDSEHYALSGQVVQAEQNVAALDATKRRLSFSSNNSN